MGIAEFLLARIAEDERVARTISARGRWAWREFADAQIYSLSDDMELSPYFSIDLSRGCVYPTATVMEHVRRHDPARVLAECEAKRQIVASLGQAQVLQAVLSDLEMQGYIIGVLDALKFLALPHADHPDYRQEWKP